MTIQWHVIPHYRCDYSSDQQLSAYYEIVDKIAATAVVVTHWIASLLLSLSGALFEQVEQEHVGQQIAQTPSPHRRPVFPHVCHLSQQTADSERVTGRETHLLLSFACCTTAQQLAEASSNKCRPFNKYCLPLAFTFGCLTTHDDLLDGYASSKSTHLLFHMLLGRTTALQWLWSG